MALTVADALAAVRTRIAAAADRAGRDPASVRLLAVSKRHPPEAVREAHAAGQTLFGENYVQELAEKADALADLPDLRWHFIGHLQRNKAKQVARLGAEVQTVDSVRLLEALARQAEGRPSPLRVWLQVNVAGEAQKSGCAPEELPAVLAAARAAPELSLVGLMTLPPLGEPEDARPYFRRLAQLAGEHGLTELSMGMSADLEVAIEEGATLVRVGTALFGDRG